MIQFMQFIFAVVAVLGQVAILLGAMGLNDESPTVKYWAEKFVIGGGVSAIAACGGLYWLEV